MIINLGDTIKIVFLNNSEENILSFYGSRIGHGKNSENNVNEGNYIYILDFQKKFLINIWPQFKSGYETSITDEKTNNTLYGKVYIIKQKLLLTEKKRNITLLEINKIIEFMPELPF